MTKKTLIILDWDDTLFPTTWVKENNIDLTHPRNKMKYSYLFSKLDQKIYDILNKLLKYGTVLIITNAMVAWVEICLEVLPMTSKMINHEVSLISARESFRNKTNNTINWKIYAFLDHYDRHFHQQPNNTKFKDIISIGDAYYEHLALVNLYTINKTKRGDRFLKSIRLLSSPSFEQLLDQLNVLEKCIDKICTQKKHIELKFSNINK